MRPPACSATALRDEDADTGNPPVNPLARLATPIAPISWLPSTESPRRAASVRDSTPVSTNAISAMPSAGPASAPTSCHAMPTRAGAGSPAGSAPTTGSRARQPRAATSAVETTTATSTPGIRPTTRRPASSRRPRITTREPTPNASAVRVVRPSAIPRAVSATCCSGESVPMEKPSSLGSWPTTTTSAMPLR